MAGSDALGDWLAGGARPGIDLQTGGRACLRNARLCARLLETVWRKDGPFATRARISSQNERLSSDNERRVLKRALSRARRRAAGPSYTSSIAASVVWRSRRNLGESGRALPVYRRKQRRQMQVPRG